MKKAISVFAAFCLALCILYVPQTFSASGAQILIRKESQSGNSVVVTVSFSQKLKNVGGFMFTLTFDENVLSYVGGSRSIKTSQISASDASRDVSSKGKIIFSADSSSPFELNGDTVSYRFDFNGVTSKGTVVSVKVNEIYSFDSSLSEIELSNSTAKITLDNANTKVQNVIGMIDSIGEVTLESESAIKQARTAYNSLLTDEKLQVSNITVLVSAEEKLNELKKKKDSEEANLDVEKFKSDYAAILSKTVKNLTLSDEKDIIDAMAAYGNLPVSRRILLIDMKNHLNRLNTRISELKKLAEDAEADRKADEEAQQLAAEWRNRWKSFIELDETQADSELLLGITSAIGAADSNALMNSFFLGYIKNEYEHLKKLKEAAQNGAGATSSAESETLKFMSDFGFLLSLGENNVTRNDEVDIRTAMAYYELLSDEAKAKLGNNVPAKLSSLLNAVEALPKDVSADGTNKNVGVKTETVTVYKNAEKEKNKLSTVKLNAPKSSALIYILAGLFGVTLILVLAAGITLIYLKKNEKLLYRTEDEI